MTVLHPRVVDVGGFGFGLGRVGVQCGDGDGAAK